MASYWNWLFMIQNTILYCRFDNFLIVFPPGLLYVILWIAAGISFNQMRYIFLSRFTGGLSKESECVLKQIVAIPFRGLRLLPVYLTPESCTWMRRRRHSSSRFI